MGQLTFLLIYSFKELTMMMRVIVVFALLLGLAFCQDQVNLNCKSNKCKFALTFDQDYNFVFKWQVSKEKVVLTSPSIDSFGPIKIDESELPTDDSVLTKDSLRMTLPTWELIVRAVQLSMDQSLLRMTDLLLQQEALSLTCVASPAR